MNLTLFLTFAEMSKWVYNPELPFFEDYNTIIKHKDYSLVESEDHCVVVFKGTNSVENAIDDILDFINPISCGYDYENLLLIQNILNEDDILETGSYLKSKCSDKEIYITGHSLGAARAVYFTYFMEFVFSTFLKPPTAVTFGEPKSCCNGGNIGIMNHYRIINGDENNYDPVVSISNGDHTHCWDGFTTFTTNPNKKFEESKFPTRFSKGFIKNIGLHHIQSYIDNLRSHLWVTFNETSLLKNNEVIKTSS